VGNCVACDCNPASTYSPIHGPPYFSATKGAVRRLLPRLRAKILQDRAILELACFDNHYRIADQADINDTADTLSRFLALPAHTLRADDLAEDLFSNEDAHVL